jgi:uncharacterized membrane protein YccC
MPRFDRAALLFALNTFAAAMLALYIGFALGMAQPYWAMTTAYIVSHPLSGAVRSKAVYRILGTLLGAAAAVALVPVLVASPILLSLALALWVGGCLTVSLLDRTPRSYVLMLAGYTAAIIGFASVNNPGAVFDTAVARVIEIGLGILCATTIHSLVFPRPVGDALQRRLAVWMAEADRWALDILRARGVEVAVADRRHLAAAASEIHILSVHLPFDTSRLRETTAEVATLHGRMVLLIPLLSGISDRMAALGNAADREAHAAINAAASWIESGASDAGRPELVARLESLAAERAGRDWSSLLVESLLVRLADLVRVLGDSHALTRHLRNPDMPLDAELASEVARAERRPMHRDLPLAVLSGAAATVAILVVCVIWIGTGWADGASAAVLAAVACCFFASMDDPVPGITAFGAFSMLALPLAAAYVFAILPAIDGFPMLVAVLLPPFVLLGSFLPDPRRASSALAVVLAFCNALALQATFSADFARFMNANLGQYVGLLSAVLATAVLRSMGVEASVERLRRRTWKSLARLARARRAPAHADFAAALVDRLGLLAPKLAVADARGADAAAHEALRELRIAMNLIAIQDLRPTLSGEPRARLDDVLAEVAEHFAFRASVGKVAAAYSALDRIDEALSALAGIRSGAVARGINGLVGLRRSLFPDAGAYVAAAPELAR